LWRAKRQNPPHEPQKVTIAILAALSASIALGDDFKTNDGKEYKDAKVRRVEADGIVVSTKKGISKLYFIELPEDVQQRYHYNPQNAAAAAAAQVAAIQQTNQQIEESNKRTEAEKQKFEAEKRKALEVSKPAQSAEGVSRENTANGRRIVGVGGVNGLEVETSEKELQLETAAREEAQTPEEKAARYAQHMKTYEGAKQTAARRGLDSNAIVPPRHGQLDYAPFANFNR
jgi:hypothetical protein